MESNRVDIEANRTEPEDRPNIEYPHVWQEFDNHEFNMAIVLEDDGVVAYAYFHRVYEGQDVGLFKTIWLYNVTKEAHGISQSIRSSNFVPPNCKSIQEECRLSNDYPATIYGVWLPGGEVECVIIYNKSQFLGCSLNDPNICYSAELTNSELPFIQPLTPEIAELFNHEMISHIMNDKLQLPPQFDSLIAQQKLPKDQ